MISSYWVWGKWSKETLRMQSEILCAISSSLRWEPRFGSLSLEPRFGLQGETGFVYTPWVLVQAYSDSKKNQKRIER